MMAYKIKTDYVPGSAAERGDTGFLSRCGFVARQSETILGKTLTCELVTEANRPALGLLKGEEN